MRTPVIVDGRNILDPARRAPPGFVYEWIGASRSRHRDAA